MNDIFCLNSGYSTTQCVTRAKPAIPDILNAKFTNTLFLPAQRGRKGEGGLRTQEYFKPGGSFDESPKKSAPPLLTVITIVLNGEAHLEQTILSVLNQGYDNVEYIIIDGGSTDGSLEIIRKYDFAIDYWVSEPDGGVSDAFNKGLSASTGQLIGIINSDDWYEPYTLQLIAPMVSGGESDIFHGQLQYWRDQDKKELVCGDHRLLDRDMTVNHPTVFVMRALYQSIGGFSTDFRYAMDYEMLLRAKKWGARFQYINRCLANMHLGGMSDLRWRKALREVVRAKMLHSRTTFGPVGYYVYQLAKGTARRILERVGMRCAVDFYHARFSLIRKIAARD